MKKAFAAREASRKGVQARCRWCSPTGSKRPLSLPISSVALSGRRSSRSSDAAATVRTGATTARHGKTSGPGPSTMATCSGRARSHTLGVEEDLSGLLAAPSGRSDVRRSPSTEVPAARPRWSPAPRLQPSGELLDGCRHCHPAHGPRGLVPDSLTTEPLPRSAVRVSAPVLPHGARKPTAIDTPSGPLLRASTLGLETKVGSRTCGVSPRCGDFMGGPSTYEAAGCTRCPCGLLADPAAARP